MGFLVGWLSGMRIPSLIRTGAWIWLLPTAFVLYDIVCALRSGDATRLSEYFYATGDNDGLGVFLLTLPVSSTVGYSIGMVVAKAQRAHPTAHAKGPGMRIAFVWAATFAIACTLMTGTERRMVERDRKIRVAVSVTGTPLASEVNALCEPVETGAARTSVVPQNVTTLEFLEHAECPGGRPRAGIDRVRVLDGPHKAAEGWVVTSRVWRPLPLP
jgi:hypothetical protein